MGAHGLVDILISDSRPIEEEALEVGSTVCRLLRPAGAQHATGRCRRIASKPLLEQRFSLVEET